MSHHTSKLRSTLGAVLALCAVVTVAFSGTAPAAVRLTANALIMDGTTFPTPSPGYMRSMIDDFITPTVGGTYSPVAVTTPEGIIGIDRSVSDGVVDLERAMRRQGQNFPGEPYVVFGFSQSSVIQTNEMIALAERRAAGESVPDVTFVGIGVGNRPNGGIASRLDGLSIPFFDFTFNGAAPTDTGFRSIDIARQYDGLADTPQFFTNPVALANAIFGVLFVHAYYGEVSLDPTSPKYVPGTVTQTYGDTTYYWIPTKDLPLFDPLRLIGVPEGVLDIVEPFVTVLVEAGYDRSVPFGEPTPAQLFPVIDPVTFVLKLAGAVVEGINNAAKLVGGGLPGYDGLADLIDDLESASAAAIGKPYGDVVRTVNNAFNPITAFSQIEGPLVNSFNDVVNATGVPKLLNDAIGTVLFPVTAWAERNVLYPYPDNSAGGPLAAAARDLLKPVFPNLGTDTASESASAATTSTADDQETPEPRRQTAKRNNEALDNVEREVRKHFNVERITPKKRNPLSRTLRGVLSADDDEPVDKRDGRDDNPENDPADTDKPSADHDKGDSEGSSDSDSDSN